jgi:ParB-like chromosome segregation protein Spo0J
MVGNEYFFNGNIQEEANLDKVNLFGTDHYILDTYQGLSTIWAFKSYLPFLKSDVYAKLEDNIKNNGIIDPILYVLTPDGQKIVIDGHASFAAAAELKIMDFPTREVTEVFGSIDEIKLWIIKRQFQRTNLTNQQKVRLAYQAKETIQALANRNKEKAANGEAIEAHVVTCEEIAKLAGVGKSTVTRFDSIMRSGNEDVIRQLENDEMTIGFADKLINESKNTAKPKAMELLSIEEGNELLKSGKIETFMIVTDRKQIDLLPKSKQGTVITSKIILNGNFSAKKQTVCFAKLLLKTV